jgi:peptide chain release factor 1
MFDDDAFLGKMTSIERRYEEVSNLLGQPDIISNRNEFAKLSKEHSDLTELVTAWRSHKDLMEQLAGAKQMIEESVDPEMKALAEEELKELQDKLEASGQNVKILLLPKDPNDSKNIILEVRAGTGGDEAALFAGDLLRMYLRFAENNGWKTETMSMSEGSSGGVKEAVISITGKDVYSKLKFESGVHRVQRVPATESQGRIHTSAASVIVMPEAEEVDIDVPDKELRIDVMRASGPGGQSVNTTDSAVRIVHIPTNITVVCKDEKSQHKNKAKAMKILMSRILDQRIAEQEAEERSARRSLVKSGDRSEKIRTYNFPQDRVTDHRINLTKRNLPGVLDGSALGDIIEALRAQSQADELQAQAESA